jgi:DNA replication protein DnaC
MPKMTPEEIAERDQRLAEEALAQQRYDREQQRQALGRLRGVRYAGCSLSNFEATTDAQQAVLGRLTDYRDNLRENVKAGVGVVWFGAAGGGKDHLMMALANAAIVREGLSVGWHNVMDWFGEVRDSFDGDRKEAKLIGDLSSPDVLMLSDPLPPFGKLTDFQANMLFRVVDKRYSMRRPTWVTVNTKGRAEAIDRMGAQIVDRLSHDAVVCFCDWPSYRQ